MVSKVSGQSGFRGFRALVRPGKSRVISAAFLRRAFGSANRQTPVDRTQAQLGAKRRVALALPFFVPAIFAVAQTDLILTAPRTLAKIAASTARLRVVEPPREIKPFP
jgi:hypothetical protein